MPDEKDPRRAPGERSANEGGGRRPFATLDLKATAVSPEDSKAEKEVAGGHPAQDRSGHGATGASARVAAAAASIRQGAGPSGVGEQGAKERISTGNAPSRGSVGAAGNNGKFTPLSGMGVHAKHLAAGVLGGVLALAGVYLFALSEWSHPPSDKVWRDFHQRLEAVEQASRVNPGSSARQDLESRLAQLDELHRSVSSLREAQAKVTEQAGADRDALARLVKVEERIAALAAAAQADPQAAGRVAEIARVTGKLTEVETRVAESGEAARAAAQRLDRELANVRSDLARINQRAEVLKAGADRLEKSLQALQADSAAATAGLESVKSDLVTQLGNVARSTDISSAVAPIATKVDALEASLKNVVRTEDERKSTAERIVLSLELANLKRAIDRGGGYAAELAAVRKVGGARGDWSALERYQYEGLATAAELTREFRGVANAILDADVEQPDASLLDRLLAGARTIVRVRKVSHSPDDSSTEAIVGRIEAALRENRLSDALLEARRLSPKAATAAQDWLRMVDARQSVDAALVRLDADLKAALTAGTSAPRGDRQ